MFFSRIVISAPLLTVTAALAVLPSTASAVDIPDPATCGTNKFADIAASVNLDSSTLVYNKSAKALLGMKSSSRSFISALPAKKPSGKVALAAYNKTKKAEIKTTTALASAAEKKLQLLVDRANEDVSDTEDARELAINQNYGNAERALEYLLECQSWVAEATYIASTRVYETTYNAAQVTADDKYTAETRADEKAFQDSSDSNLNTILDLYQPLCAKDPGYALKPDDYGLPAGTGDEGTDPDWVSTNSIIPSAIKGKGYAEAAQLLIKAGFTGPRKEVKKITNMGKVGQVFASSPGIGGLAAKTATIQLWVRSNKKDVKGLPQGTVKSTGAVMLISKKSSKKPKGKPVPAPKKPSSEDIADCVENVLEDPRFGHDATVDRLEDALDNNLDDAAIELDKTLDAAGLTYQRNVEDAERVLSNPFAFNLPYDEAMAQLDNRTETANFLSSRQTTEDMRQVEDNALDAQEYLSRMYGTDIELN